MNATGTFDESAPRRDEQFARMEAMRETTVLLSETTTKVEFMPVAEVMFDVKVACISGPPGRLVLSGAPYCINE